MQLQEKQSRRTVERQRDEFWQAVQISEAQKLLRREQQEAQERKSKAADVAGMQRQQLEEYKQRYVEQLFAEKQEGERLLSQAQRAVQEEQEKLRQTRERAKNDQRSACTAQHGAPLGNAHVGTAAAVVGIALPQLCARRTSGCRPCARRSGRRRRRCWPRSRRRRRRRRGCRSCGGRRRW